MLTDTQMMIAGSLFVGDVLVIGSYLDPHDAGGEKKRYPKRAFLLHVFGGLGAILLGALALLVYSLGNAGLAASLGFGQGVVVACLAGLFALPMSRHTAGFKGFNLVGYVLYTVAWMVSALLLVWAPGPEKVYACFVLTHAYLSCRVLVWAVERGWEKLRGRAPDPDLAYSVATVFAAMIPLVIAWGMVGLILHLGMTVTALGLHMTRVSSPWHARYSPGD